MVKLVYTLRSGRSPRKGVQVQVLFPAQLQSSFPRFFDLPFSVFSLIGTAEVTVVIWLAIALILLLRRRFTTLLFFCLFLAGLVIETVGKLFISHPAPPSNLYRGVFHLDLPSSQVPVVYSYPSGHLFRTAFLIVFLIAASSLLLKKSQQRAAQIALLAFLFVMAVSRVYLAEHWTSDVIGGLLLGISFGCLASASLVIKKS